MFKRAKTDLEPVFGFTSSRVRLSTQQDWSTLVKLMTFILGTKDEVMALSADDSQNFHCYIDAAFRVRPGVRSHTGRKFSIVYGDVSSSSTK